MSDPVSTPPVLAGEVLAPRPSVPGGFLKGGDPRRNNKGRPTGAKQAIGENFLKDLLKWHKLHGWKAIEKVGREKPEELLRIMASMVPKEAHVDVEHRGGIVLGSVALQDVEQRTFDLLRRIESSSDSNDSQG